MSGVFGSGPKPPDPYQTAASQYKYGKKAARDNFNLSKQAMEEAYPHALKAAEDTYGFSRRAAEDTLDFSNRAADDYYDKASTALTDSLKANRYNTSGPTGSTTWTANPDGTWSMDASLSPELEGHYSSLVNAMGDFDRPGYEKTLYDRSTALIRPDLEQARDSQMTRLNTQGIPVGSEAYNKVVDSINRNEYDIYNRAAQDAVIQGGAESRADRGANFDQIANILSLTPRGSGYTQGVTSQGVSSPVVTSPVVSSQGISPTGVVAPDLAGMIYNNYAQRSANHNNKKQGIGNLVGTGALLYGGSQGWF